MAKSDTTLRSLAESFLTGNTSDVVDVITFIESPWGLNFRLTPVQKFILKCFYNLPLEDKEKIIKVPDVVNSETLYDFTEIEYLNWLYDEGRCNTKSVEGKKFRELVLVLGRRGGKSTITSCVSNYEMYKLIKRGDPSRFYGFPPETQICVTNVAPTDEQASVLFNMTLSFSSNCPFLRDRTVNQTLSYFNLQTDADAKHLGKRKRASVLGITGGCASNSLRGRNNIVVIMDEMAFFIDNGGRFSGEEVYKALTPSTATFKGDGKVICISSPYAKYGAFYDRFNQSFQEQDTTLMFKMYSAMVNPQVDPVVLKADRRRNRVSFMCEYGGEFSEKITAWIDDENEFRKCIVNNPKFIQDLAPEIAQDGDFWFQPATRTKYKRAGAQWTPFQDELPTRGVTGVNYYMGIDLGLKNDGTALAIVHKDARTKKIYFDYGVVWFSASSDVWEIENGIYRKCTKFADKDILQVSDIAHEIKELCKWFPIKAGWFDQYNGYSLMENLQKLGLKQFRMEQVTDTLNNDVYQVVKSLYLDKLLEIYDHPILIPELLSLEAEKQSKNKTKVRAPAKTGAHDDLSDAFARAIWEAYQHTCDKSEHITSLVKGGSMIDAAEARETSIEFFKMQKMKNHGVGPRVILKNRKPMYR
jgi:phage terminase large subunit-like protein